MQLSAISAVADARMAMLPVVPGQELGAVGAGVSQRAKSVPGSKPDTSRS